MVTVQVVGDIRVNPCPGLECLELEFGLGHVTVKVIEVTELFGSELCVGIGGVVAFVVFDIDVDAVFFGGGEEGDVVFEEFDCRFGDHDVDSSLDGIESNGVVGGVWGEDCDGIAGFEGVDGGLVGVGIFCVVGGEGLE